MYTPTLIKLEFARIRSLFTFDVNIPALKDENQTFQYIFQVFMTIFS